MSSISSSSPSLPPPSEEWLEAVEEMSHMDVGSHGMVEGRAHWLDEGGSEESLVCMIRKFIGHKSSKAQFKSMKAKLEAGRQRLLDAGVPDEHIVYVVRNNRRSSNTHFDRMGGLFAPISDAIESCSCVLTASHLYQEDLFDVHAMNGVTQKDEIKAMLEDETDESIDAYVNPPPPTYEMTRLAVETKPSETD